VEIDVVTGHDDDLFLRQGSNEVLRFYTEPDYDSMGWPMLRSGQQVIEWALIGGRGRLGVEVGKASFL
jgi:hypothetical protein